MEGALAFQPLHRIDDPAERAWAAEWIAALLDAEKGRGHARGEDAVWSALNSLASAPPQERTLTGLAMLLQSNALRTAIQPTRSMVRTAPARCGGKRPRLRRRNASRPKRCWSQARVVAPVLTYLFHRLEERFDGRPTLLILDEAWIFLDHPFFAARIREWLKTLRKKNVAVLFATQSLADIADSSIAPAIIESCPQRILLPNDRAIEPQSRAARTVRAQRPADRADQPRHPQAALLSAIGARQSAVRAGAGPDRAGALRRVRSRQPEADRCILAEHGADGFAAQLLNPPISIGPPI
jgi:type IV secretion system protein VirB4